LADVKTYIQESTDEFIKFKFVGVDFPMVMKKDEVETQGEALLKHYRVDLGERL
jgi:hypothetical protein